MSVAPATIATWFVADSKEDATYFPQIGGQTNTPRAQMVYWQCIVVFYASSLAVNPGLRHVFYTNTDLPTLGGTSLGEIFDRWGVEVVRLPITFRLPRGSVKSWGNQFYVFDVMAHHAQHGDEGTLLLLDSDCVFVRSASSMLERTDECRALTYELGLDEYVTGEVINGQTRAGLARFAASHGAEAKEEIAYCGGEIYCATAPANRDLVRRAQELWPEVVAQGQDAPREEAHFLSALYALEGIEIATAQAFIRRMWTTFKYSNLRPGDMDLTIWHLPAEKKTGFADLFRQIQLAGFPDPAGSAAALGLNPSNYARVMGYPRRRPAKFARDLALKLREKAGLAA